MATVVGAALWIVVWVALSVLVAVLLGGVAAIRNRQVPRPDAVALGAVSTLPGPREPGPFTGGADPRAPVPGR